MNFARRRKLAFWILFVTALIGAAITYSLSQKNVTYYYTVSEIKQNQQSFQSEAIRVMGLVQPGSVSNLVSGGTEQTAAQPSASNAKTVNKLQFVLSEETQQELVVQFTGVKPDLFKEGQGVVAEGTLDNTGIFQATTLLVKHSEEYRVDPEHKKQKETYYRSLQETL